MCPKKDVVEGAFLLETVIVALISGAVTLAGVLASNSKSRAVMEQKIDALTRRVEKHNCLVERTYLLERGVAVANLDLLVRTMALEPEWKALVVALVMAVLSPVMAELGKHVEAPEGGDGQ